MLMRSMTFPLMKMNFRSLNLRSERYVQHLKRNYKPLSHIRPVNRSPRPRLPPLSLLRRKQNRLRVVSRRLSQLMWGRKIEIDLAYVTMVLMIPVLARGVLLPRLLSECCHFLCACCRYYDNTICADIALSSRKRVLHAPQRPKQVLMALMSFSSFHYVVITDYRSLQQRLYQHYINLSQDTTHYTDKRRVDFKSLACSGLVPSIRRISYRGWRGGRGWSRR